MRTCPSSQGKGVTSHVSPQTQFIVDSEGKTLVAQKLKAQPWGAMGVLSDWRRHLARCQERAGQPNTRDRRGLVPLYNSPMALGGMLI